MTGNPGERTFTSELICAGGSGRIPRGRYAAVLACQLAAAALLAGVAAAAGNGVLFALCLAPVWLAAAATVRRLHDLGKSGWWLVAVAAVLPLGLLLVAAGEGEPGDNRWGPNPKGLLRLDDPRRASRVRGL